MPDHIPPPAHHREPIRVALDHARRPVVRETREERKDDMRRDETNDECIVPCILLVVYLHTLALQHHSYNLYVPWLCLAFNVVKVKAESRQQTAETNLFRFAAGNNAFKANNVSWELKQRCSRDLDHLDHLSPPVQRDATRAHACCQA